MHILRERLAICTEVTAPRKPILETCIYYVLLVSEKGRYSAMEVLPPDPLNSGSDTIASAARAPCSRNIYMLKILHMHSTLIWNYAFCLRSLTQVKNCRQPLNVREVTHGG